MATTSAATATSTTAPAGAPAGGPRAAKHAHDPLGPVGDFLPWIIYWGMAGSVAFRTTLAVAAGVAVLLLVVRRLSGAPMRTLGVGSAAVFVVLLGLAFVVSDAFLERWLQPLANLGLLLVVLGGMAVRRPFVMDYAKESVSPEMAASSGFLWLNQRFTAIWAVAFGVMTVSSFIPPLVEGDATIKEGGSTLSIVGYWVVPFVALGIAAAVNVLLVKGLRGPDGDDDTPGTGLTPAAAAGSSAPADAAVPAWTVTVPEASMADEDLPVRVEGVPAGSTVAVEVDLADVLNRRFTSRATFDAPDGRVDTSADAPTTGSWTGADAGAAIWAASWDEAGDPELFLPSWGPMSGQLRVEVDGSSVVRTFTRRGLVAGAKVEEVSGHGVVGRLFLPAGTAAGAAVLVGGSEGGVDSMSADAAFLANHGVAALVVGLFGAPGLPDSLVEVPLEPIGAGAALVAERAGVDPSAVVLVGISRGSEAVLSAASHLVGLSPGAVVALSPGAVVWEALADDGSPTGRSSWTVTGAPLPFVGVDDVAVDRDLLRSARRSVLHRHAPHLMHLRAAYEGGLAGPAAAAATIPVERITGRIHLVAGGADALWPSDAMAKLVVERRKAHGRTDDDVAVLPGAGHLLRTPLVPVRPFNSGGIVFGGEPAAQAAAQRAVGDALLHAAGAQPAPS